MLPHHHFLLGLLLLLSLHTQVSSTITDAVSPSHALIGSDRLVSNNSKFVLGFFKPGNESSYTKHNSYLGIWFNKVPKLTPLWTANGDNPVVDPTSPELTIFNDGNLAILDHATKSIIWSTHANITTNDTIAVLLNNGNLVLRSSSNSSKIFWQSFDYPTDSLFAGAKIGWDKVTGLNRRLVSRKNSIDQAPGIYSLELSLNGDGYLLWNSTVPYRSSGDWNGRYFGLAPEMIGVVMPNFTFVHNDQEAYFTYTLYDDKAIVHTGIDVFGRGFAGMWLEGSQDWLIHYRQPVVHCDVYAICGPFTICDDNKDLFCNCMKGFSIKSPKDWELDDRTGGCTRNTPLSCDNSKDRTGLTDKFYPMQNIRLPHNAENVQNATSGDECSQACVSKCSCLAYSYGKGGCLVWHDELYNVKQQSDGSSDGNEGVLYIRLAAKELQSSKREKSAKIIGVAIGASTGSTLLLMILLQIVWRRKGKWFSRTLEKPDDGIGIMAFRYIDLQRATKNFLEKLGGGSFGSVFKGYLSDSTIAVKRLDGARQGEKQFRAEVNSIGIIQHINLVKLVGFCCEGDNRLLVYEYMPNRSLDVRLFEANDKVLDWTTRYQIAIGVARGLAYLHNSCRNCIIHCEIKPENILLDTSCVPKIADFGIAKILGREFSRAITTMRGTIGYLAPEWISGTVVTSKVDVYSYGMVLFEIISGRRNSSHENFKDGDYSFFFPMQAAHKLLNGEIGSLVDANLKGDVNLMEVERACKIACWCIQDHEFDRPAMGEVVQSLEGLLELDMPPLPRLLNAITGGSRSVSPQYFESL